MTNQRGDRPARLGLATDVHRLRPLSGAVAAQGSRQYTDEERQTALMLAEQIGPKAAAQQLDIPENTLAGWRDKARRDAKAAMQAYLEEGGRLEELTGPAPDWRTRREQAGNRFGLYAEMIADHTLLAMMQGNDRLVRAGAQAVAVFTDRAQVLCGGEIPKPITAEERAQRIERVIEGIRRRKAEAEAAQAEEAS